MKLKSKDSAKTMRALINLANFRVKHKLQQAVIFLIASKMMKDNDFN